MTNIPPSRKLYTLEETKKHWASATSQTKEFFQNTNSTMPTENHARHTKDPEYQKYILAPIRDTPELWRGKTALDFGCGCGRNIKNLLEIAPWARVDGCDISRLNAEYSKKYVLESFDDDKCNTWESDGYGVSVDSDTRYDFVMSHIVFQHIANYSIRYHILADIYRVLKPGGFVSLHFMDLDNSGRAAPYYENYPISMAPAEDAPRASRTSFNLSPSWAMKNCVVRDENYLIMDFEEIGFRDVVCHTGTDPYSGKKSYYVWGSK